MVSFLLPYLHSVLYSYEYANLVGTTSAGVSGAYAVMMQA